MTNPSYSLLTTFGVAILLGAVSLHAQDVVVDQYGTEYAPELVKSIGSSARKPSVPKVSPPPGVASATAPSAAPRSKSGSYLAPQQTGLSQESLVGRLRGVVLVPTPGDVVLSGIPGVEGVWHDLEDFPPRAGNAINAYIGQPVSLASLDAMVKDTIRAYRASDRPVVDVLVPEQDITSGVVQLVVVEGRLGAVRVQGAKRGDEEYLRSQIKTEKGEVLYSSEVMGDLSWMNRSPNRRVDMVYAPGYKFGETDIILKTNQVDPIEFYIGAENSGNELLGEERFLMGLNWTEAFGPDRNLNYQLTSDFRFDRLVSHTMVYTAPLPWRHYVTLLGAYVDTAATIAAGDVPLETGGTSWQLSPRYTIPLRRAPEGMNHEIEFGFDFKSSNNDLAFGGQGFFDVTTHIYQWSMGYNALRQWKNAATRLDLTGYLSPGGVDSHNQDLTFDATSFGANSKYGYLTAGVEHTQRLPREFSFRLRTQGQMANENLLASEQLGIGGPSTVRGYATSVTRGDHGFLLSGEIYSPTYSLGDWFDWRSTNDELQFLVFADYGTVGATNLLPGAMDTTSLFSLGVGLRWTYNEWLRLRLDLGFPIDEDLPVGTPVEDFRLNAGVTATF
jgi:hemolysin activation/secretion protein